MKSGFLFLFIFLPFILSAQSDSEKVAQRISALNTAIFITKDSTTLENLLAEKVSYGHSSGKVQDRKQLIHDAANATISYNNFHMDSSIVYITEKTAIARHELSAVSVDKTGKESPLHIAVLQVWIKQKGYWRLTARQAVKI